MIAVIVKDGLEIYLGCNRDLIFFFFLLHFLISNTLTCRALFIERDNYHVCVVMEDKVIVAVSLTLAGMFP